jgi:hypothetical protein
MTSEGGGDVPDGNYQVFVDKVELRTSKSGDPMLFWQLRIIGPSHANQCLFRYSMIVTKQNMSFLKGDLALCGLELVRLSDLETDSALAQLLDVKLEVNVKTKGDFQNIYFNKRIVSDVSSGPPPGHPAGDDVPF